MSARLALLRRAGVPAFGVVTIAIPVVAVSITGAATTDPVWTALRLTALEGFTLVFVDILIGAFRPFLNRLFRSRTVHAIHVGTGLAGLLLIVCHAILLLIDGLVGYPPAFVWLGPAALAVLALTLATAFARRRLRRSWKWMHRLNYLVFIVALVHALALGYDTNIATWLRAWFLICAAAVAAALMYRLARRTSKKPIA